jgi:hypothetical protein
MALAFKNSAILSTPVVPRCFRSCNGILLIPELLFALKWFFNTIYSSAGAMWFPFASSNGVNVSGGMDSSKKIFSLNFWNAGNGKSVFTFSRLFSMPQNYLGLYFSISGSWNCSCARPSLQLYTYLLSACWVCVCVFPLFFTAVLYFVRAVLHRSVNHGARCFSHLFGFVDVRLVVAFSTPAFVASSIRKFSIFIDLSSLFSLYSFNIV